MQHQGQPTVILAKTVKGYGLGEAGEGRNITHQQKKLNEKELREFRARFGIPISDDDIAETPFYRPRRQQPGDASICWRSARRWAVSFPSAIRGGRAAAHAASWRSSPSF